MRTRKKGVVARCSALRRVLIIMSLPRCNADDRVRDYLVVHHELDNVEEPPRLPARLVVAHAVEHGLELLPADQPVAILVDLPDHILHVSALALVLQLLQSISKLLRAHLWLVLLGERTRLLMREDLEDALQILELLRFVILGVALALRIAASARAAHRGTLTCRGQPFERNL